MLDLDPLNFDTKNSYQLAGKAEAHSSSAVACCAYAGGAVIGGILLATVIQYNLILVVLVLGFGVAMIASYYSLRNSTISGLLIGELRWRLDTLESGIEPTWKDGEAEFRRSDGRHAYYARHLKKQLAKRWIAHAFYHEDRHHREWHEKT